MDQSGLAHRRKVARGIRNYVTVDWRPDTMRERERERESPRLDFPQAQINVFNKCQSCRGITIHLCVTLQFDWNFNQKKKSLCPEFKVFLLSSFHFQIFINKNLACNQAR